MKTIEELGEELCEKYCDSPINREDGGCRQDCTIAYQNYLKENNLENELISEGDEMDNNEIKNNVLNINFNISEEQLANRILEKVENKIEKIVIDKLNASIMNSIKKQIDEMLLSTVATKTAETISKFVDDIYSNTTLQIPKKQSYYSEKVEFESIILKEYVLKEIKCLLESGNYNYSSDKMSLQSYLKKLIEKDIVDNAKRVVEKEVTTIKRDVDTALKSTFDEATKRALSEQVFNVLMTSETYQKLENSMKLLGGK